MVRQAADNQGFTGQQKQELLNLIEPFFAAINTTLSDFQKTQISQQQTLSQHTGSLAEILVKVNKLDAARLITHDRITEASTNVEKLQPRVSQLEKHLLGKS